MYLIHIYMHTYTFTYAYIRISLSPCTPALPVGLRVNPNPKSRDRSAKTSSPAHTKDRNLVGASRLLTDDRRKQTVRIQNSGLTRVCVCMFVR